MVCNPAAIQEELKFGSSKDLTLVEVLSDPKSNPERYPS